MNSVMERVTHNADQVKACTLFERIESALAEARSRDETVCDALKRVRALMHNEFRDLTVTRSFVIEDDVDFRSWHVRVRYPDDREVEITQGGHRAD